MMIFCTVILSRQQTSTLLYNIELAGPQLKANTVQCKTNQYIAQCASKLNCSWTLPRTISYRPFCAALEFCFILSICVIFFDVMAFLTASNVVGAVLRTWKLLLLLLFLGILDTFQELPKKYKDWIAFQTCYYCGRIFSREDFVPGGFCPGRILSREDFVRGGFCPGRILSQEDFGPGRILGVHFLW